VLSENKTLIKEALGREIIRTSEHNGFLYVHLKSPSVLRCMSILSSNASLKLTTLADCFAVDFKRKGISIYYQLINYESNLCVFIVTNISRNGMIQSVSLLFENANWLEREIFDMFGILFHDHPDMRRLLNNHDYNLFPLMKS
jgi:NADH-quinone oxidoreductase subunit C